ncbi:Gfo/Idh/MocA family protein [Candidatus Latescibacterota bacterium]
MAVVGCGYWGPNLIRNFESLPESKIKTIVDIDTQRLSHIKDIYQDIVTSTNYDDVINDSDIDAVAIATPVNMHFEFAQKSLKACKHTFIEKPMASSSKQCSKLIELAEKNNLTLMIGHTFIFTPAVRKIKEIVDSGDLGNIYYINAQRLNLGLFQRDINVAWDLGPHDLSIILFVLNQMPVSVNCQGKANITKDIEDTTNMTINFHNGGFATIQSSWLDPNKVRRMTFVGSKKMLLYDDTEPLEKIKIYDKRVDIPPYYDSFGEFQYSYHYGDIQIPYFKGVEPLKSECQQFIDCIKTGNKSESSGHEGMKIVKILEAASDSLRQRGSEVRIVI